MAHLSVESKTSNVPNVEGTVIMNSKEVFATYLKESHNVVVVVVRSRPYKHRLIRFFVGSAEKNTNFREMERVKNGHFSKLSNATTTNKNTSSYL